MAIGRRELLALGGAVALSAATASCRTGQEADDPSTLPTRPTAEPVPPSPGLFPGQPPPGMVYYGATVPHDRAVITWEKTLGSTLALRRSFFSQDRTEVANLVRRCRDDLIQGRLAHISVKPTSTWQSIAAGQHDRWLRRILRPLGELDGPVLFTMHHEPENDAGRAGMQSADFVEMQRRLIRLSSELAPQVTIVPVMQHWTFDPVRDDVDPRAWIVPEAKAIGLDIYNPWSPKNGKEWRTFGSKCDEVIGWLDGTPIVIGEYGTQEDPGNPGLATEWLRDAADYAKRHEFVSMSYFNSELNTPDGSYSLRGETERAFAEMLAEDWVARLGSSVPTSR